MSPRPPQFAPARARRFSRTVGGDAARRGFSFVEILFAIAVLGIGFIMLAALFPVGLKQTKLTMDETNAAANARGAVAGLAHIADANLQYLAIGVNPPGPANTSTVLPYTYTGGLPTPVAANVTPGPNQLAAGTSITLPGLTRSFRDGRAFADYPSMNITDTGKRRDAIWQRVNGELLSQSNDRNASTMLYRRDLIVSCITNSAGVPVIKMPPTPAPTVQVIVINAQVAEQSAYTSKDVTINTASSPSTPTICNLEPRPVGVIIQIDASGVSTATISSAKGGGVATATTFGNLPEYDAAVNAVTEGAYIIISDDRITAPFRDIGRMNGRIYRIGVPRPDLGLNVFELAPGFDFTRDPGSSGLFNDAAGDDILAIGVTAVAPGYNNSSVTVAGPAIAYVLGRGFVDPSTTPTAAGGYAGPAQDVAIYTTFVPAQ